MFLAFVPASLNPHAPRGRGRPALLSHYDVLALTLHWISSSASIFTLALQFGLTMSTTSVMLRLGRTALLKALKASPEAEVRFPSVTLARTWADTLMQNAIWALGAVPALVVYPFCFLDGTFMRIPKIICEMTQRLYYSGKATAHGTLSLCLSAPRSSRAV